MNNQPLCQDCDRTDLLNLNRRQFVRVLSTAAAGAALLKPGAAAGTETQKAVQSETLVQKLYQSLTPEQKEEICFPWDYQDDRGLLRTHVSNNWSITAPNLNVGGDFFTKDQRDLIEAIFYGLYNPEWHARLRQQLQDDAQGYGRHQTIALFGEPGSGTFEFVMTGRHLTIRCDGDSTEHMAFGGPIFYGHAARGFNEAPDHPGNVYWPQALKANALYQMLDGRQREQALIAEAPAESRVDFQGTKPISGLPVSDLSSDQKEHVQDVLKLLLEPYRMSDRSEVHRCLDAQGGLDRCRLAFYQSGDLGNDGIWDVWRLEGPAFVWHFRGVPHVHVWVNVADAPTVALNSRG